MAKGCYRWGRGLETEAVTLTNLDAVRVLFGAIAETVEAAYLSGRRAAEEAVPFLNGG